MNHAGQKTIRGDEVNYGDIFARSLAESLATKTVKSDSLLFEDFAAKNLKIRDIQGNIVPFVVRPIQQKYLNTKRAAVAAGKAPRFLLLKYRRGGFTTIEQGLSYFLSSRKRNVNVLTLAQEIDATSRIFRIPKLMHELDPDAPEVRGLGSNSKLDFCHINSIFYVGTAAGKGVGRGDTLSRVHWSEVAWSCTGSNQVQKQRDILTGLSEACSHGEMVLETTPNGSEMFREMYFEAKNGKSNFTAIFLPWFEDYTNRIAGNQESDRQIMSTITDEEARLIRKHNLDANQIRWRRSKIVELKGMFYQEYPEDDETCWLMSGTPFFTPEVVMFVRDNCKSPELIDDVSCGLGTRPINSKALPNGYEVVWEEPKEGVEYCMGVDTSEGLRTSDPNGCGVMRRDNGKQVCAIHGRFNPKVLADHVCRLMKKYNALTGVERENHGHAVLGNIIDMGMGKSHLEGGLLYHYSSISSKEMRIRPENAVIKSGWSTNVITRPIMIQGLRDWFETEHATEIVMDRHFLNECMTFRLQSNGSFEADPGSSDDCVMKWAIANQMRMIDWRGGGGLTIKQIGWR